ncbi:AMP-binding protein [Paenibacillus protaetiae]|uniref:CoF synthetase n=1 Tax=Paenibacillus protaetiae TaxID=2509456 RepID=A0A4P6EQH6_9BACL|nr:AMP-binding protein [Paenibacillus protaetiae]QAY65220.1 CoF synthetase [Paenibacillus protaetiae]
MLPQQLRELVEQTCAAFPWYKALLPNGGERAEVRLDELPLINGQLLERHYYTASMGGAFAVYRTSGTSSGGRKAIAYSKQDERHYLEVKAKLYDRLTAGAGIKRALADMGTGHAASTALDVFRRLGWEADAIPFEEPVEKHVLKLLQMKPDLLYTMPSILDRIIAASDDPSAFGVRRILLVGEVASPQWRRRAAERFGIGEDDIVDTYGSIEIGTIAYYDSVTGRYLFADGITAETVPAEALGEGFEPLPGGEAVLVLTSRLRDHFPALRFVTYDVVRDFAEIEIDGERVPSFAGIVKRIGKELKHGEKISVYDIEDAVYRFADQAQVKVAAYGRKLSVQIASDSITDERLGLIREAIEHQIPEIGSMIRGGLLDGIDVSLSKPQLSAAGGAIPVKSKKMHYGMPENDVIADGGE